MSGGLNLDIKSNWRALQGVDLTTSAHYTCNSETNRPVTEKLLRQVLRQEMPEYLRGLTAARTRTRAKSGARR